MAQNKKSFLIYCDVIHTVKHLSNEQAGELFKHLLSYVNDENPTTDNVIVNLAFEPIKQQLKRDLKKYESISDRNRENGSKGGKPKKPKKPTGLNGLNKKPKKADTDTDTVIDKDKDINKSIPAYEEFENYALSKKNVSKKDLKLKFDSWIENDWKDGNDKKIVNWKSKILNVLRFMDETKEKEVYLPHSDNHITFG